MSHPSRLEPGALYTIQAYRSYLLVVAMYREAGTIIVLEGWREAGCVEKFGNSWEILSKVLGEEYLYVRNLRFLSDRTSDDIKNYKKVGRHDWEVKRRLSLSSWDCVSRISQGPPQPLVRFRHLA